MKTSPERLQLPWFDDEDEPGALFATMVDMVSEGNVKSASQALRGLAQQGWAVSFIGTIGPDPARAGRGGVLVRDDGPGGDARQVVRGGQGPAPARPAGLDRQPDREPAEAGTTTWRRSSDELRLPTS